MASIEGLRRNITSKLVSGFLGTREAKGIPFVFVKAIVEYCVDEMTDALDSMQDDLKATGGVDASASACTAVELVRPLAAPRAMREGDTKVFDLVIADMQERFRFGVEKYGMPLIVEDGRPAMIDAYQEILDLVMYIRKVIEIMKRRFGEVL